jgi:hypothetical protein
MKIILWISIILTAAILFVLNPWNNLPLNYSLIVFVILGGPVAGTVSFYSDGLMRKLQRDNYSSRNPKESTFLKGSLPGTLPHQVVSIISASIIVIRRGNEIAIG